MDLVGSIDFSLSKEGGWEAFSLIDTTFGDVLEHDQEPITNEQILPDDVFLDTWTLDPYRIILNRRQDATAPLLRGKLVTVYGPDRRKDLEMMTVIDLRTMDRGALRSYRPIDCDNRGSGRRGQGAFKRVAEDARRKCHVAVWTGVEDIQPKQSVQGDSVRPEGERRQGAL